MPPGSLWHCQFVLCTGQVGIDLITLLCDRLLNSCRYIASSKLYCSESLVYREAPSSSIRVLLQAL